MVPYSALGWGPAMIPSMSAASATDRVIGPMHEKLIGCHDAGPSARRGTRPCVPLMP